MPVSLCSILPWRFRRGLGVSPSAFLSLKNAFFAVQAVAKAGSEPTRLLLGKDASRWCSKTPNLALLPHMPGQGHVGPSTPQQLLCSGLSHHGHCILKLLQGQMLRTKFQSYIL